MGLVHALFKLLAVYWICTAASSQGSDGVSLLPTLPLDFLDRIANSSTYQNPHPQKPIPRNLWVTFKKRPKDLDKEVGASLLRFLSMARNDSWRVHLLGHDEQEAFLDEFYPNTAITWAYKNIHPDAGASASDIFRYSALYAFGGMFMDDDSIMTASPEQVVRLSDTMILTQEKTIADSKPDCFHSTYRLSKAYLRRHYQFDSFRSVYGGKVVAQWAFFSAPLHSVLRKVLENAVDVIRHEFSRESVISRFIQEPMYKLVFCSTGPNLLTSTIVEMWLENNRSLPLRMTNADFREYGGEFKVDDHGWLGRKEHHYMTKMTRNRSPLLRTYSEFNLSHYEGRPIRICHKNVTAMPIYLVRNGTRHKVPDWDTFQALNFSHENILTMYSPSEYFLIPEGAPMPALDFKGS